MYLPISTPMENEHRLEKRKKITAERREKVVKGEDKAFHICTKERWKEIYSGMLASTRKRQSQESEMRLLVEKGR